MCCYYVASGIIPNSTALPLSPSTPPLPPTHPNQFQLWSPTQFSLRQRQKYLHSVKPTYRNFKQTTCLYTWTELIVQIILLFFETCAFLYTLEVDQAFYNKCVYFLVHTCTNTQIEYIL